MKVINFQGDLNDISAKTATLTASQRQFLAAVRRRRCGSVSHAIVHTCKSLSLVCHNEAVWHERDYNKEIREERQGKSRSPSLVKRRA